MIAEERIHEARYDYGGLGRQRLPTSRHCLGGAEGIELGERHKSDLAAIYPHLADRGPQSSPPNELGEPFLAADDAENGKPSQHQSLHLC